MEGLAWEFTLDPIDQKAKEKEGDVSNWGLIIFSRGEQKKGSYLRENKRKVVRTLRAPPEFSKNG